MPSAFLPDEDQGYFIILIQAPEGASLEYTSNIGKQVEQVLLTEKDIASAFTVSGFSFSGASPNRGLLFVRLKPYDERTERRAVGAGDRRRACAGRSWAASAGRLPCRSCRRRFAASARSAGSSSRCSTRPAGRLKTWPRRRRTSCSRGTSQPELRGLFTSFTTGDPQLTSISIAQRVKALNMPLNEVTDALQVFLGSQYVNDFDFNNRAYRVYVQADQRFRNDPTSLAQFYARAGTGEMVPLSNLVHVKETTAPQVISHFNLFRSAEINGAAAPGYSWARPCEAMGDLASRTLPVGMTYAWAGQSLEEINAGSQAGVIFALGLLLVYLTLVGAIRKLPAAVHHPAGGSGGTPGWTENHRPTRPAPVMHPG